MKKIIKIELIILIALGFILGSCQQPAPTSEENSLETVSPDSLNIQAEILDLLNQYMQKNDNSEEALELLKININSGLTQFYKDIEDEIDINERDGAGTKIYTLDQTDIVANFKTEAIRSRFDVLDNCISRLISVSGQAFSGLPKSRFNFYLYPYKLTAAEAGKYYDYHNTNNPNHIVELRNECNTIAACNPCNTKSKIVNCFLKDRLSIYAKISYRNSAGQDIYITTDTYTDSSGNLISTIFNIGRLCPPKCQQ